MKGKCTNNRDNHSNEMITQKNLLILGNLRKEKTEEPRVLNILFKCHINLVKPLLS